MSDPTVTPTPTEDRRECAECGGELDMHYLSCSVWAWNAAKRPLAAVSAAAPDCGCGHPASFHTPHCYDVCGCETFHAAATPGEREVDPAWLTRTVEASRAYLDNLPASARPAWYRARVNGDDAWWESLVQAECAAGHVIFVDDGDGTVYACPACALAEVRAALAARPAPVVSGECDHARAAREIARTTPLSLDASTVLIDSLARGAATLADAWTEGHRIGWEHCQDGNYGNDYWDDDTPNPYRTVADAPAAEPERLALDGFPATEASDYLDAVVRASGQEHHTLDCPLGCVHTDAPAADDEGGQER